MSNPHIGSDFDDFLQEEGILEEVEAAAIKKVVSLLAQAGQPSRYTSVKANAAAEGSLRSSGASQRFSHPEGEPTGVPLAGE